MVGTVRGYFKDYADTKNGFEDFHKEVINMPRPDFQNIGFGMLRVLASYLLLIENKTSPLGNDYKEILELINNEITSGNYPEIRNVDFENTYLNFTDINAHYNDPSIIGRMFRHYMGLCAFWGMIETISKQKKIIKFDICKNFTSIAPERVNDFIRNLSFNINIKNNDFIESLRGIKKVKSTANYHPTLAILKYMNAINRPVTDFEVSVLLGRVDNLQDEAIILQRALDIGNEFTNNDRNGQQQEFFKAIGWVDSNGALFSYKSSQQPWFKFHTYFLFMKDFGLITLNQATNNYSITNEAKDLLGDLPANILDLNKLIAKLNLDSKNISDTTMKDVLIRSNLETLKSLLLQEDLVKKLNHYSINNPIISKDGKKKRNQFIAELARIRENYCCQAGTRTFQRPDGRNYVEAHHIIEFSKDGPDILENLLALGPTPHMQIHRGSSNSQQDIYTHLMTNGSIKYSLFKTMAEEYHCLTIEHLDFLENRKLISLQQKNELVELICQ